jgi:tight adherence protein C
VLLVLAGGCGLLAVFFLARALGTPWRQRRATLKRARAYGLPAKAAGREVARDRLAGRLEHTIDLLSRAGRRLAMPGFRETVDIRLLQAGFSASVTARDTFAAKIVLGGVGLGFGALVGQSPAQRLLLAPAFAFAAFMLPDVVIAMRRKPRRAQMRAELPDALDMLAVCVEGGLGFDGALAKLVDHMEGPLTQEFRLVLGEMRIGEDRHRALRRMADRVEIDEVAAFANAVVQAEQMGSSMAGLLRVQAADARRRPHAAAEERAMKAPVKMLFPTAVFIFPAMFIAILGPALLTISKLFD